MFPTKNEEYPTLVLDPTDQYTFLDKAPFLRIMDESSPIVSVVDVWNIHTGFVPLRPSNTKYDNCAIVKYPSAEQYTPGVKTKPDNSLLLK